MDETIINYYYFDTSLNIQEVNGINYNYFLNDSWNNKPLKLEYTIKYDSNGNPYNNLNIRDISDISRNIYIFKPKELDISSSYTHFNISGEEVDSLLQISGDEMFIHNFSNITIASGVGVGVIKDLFRDKISFDISENIDYNKDENSTNFILRPGKWYIGYDSSANQITNKINKNFKKHFLLSSIEIPYIDFLYNNKNIIMEINTKTYKEIFLTIDQNELLAMRNYFSKYYKTLGKKSNNDNNEFMRLFFDMMLWTPNNHGEDNWTLPNDYKGINDSRIFETPSYYKDVCNNEILYTGYYNDEPGIRQDKTSYENNFFYSNHIASINYTDGSTIKYNTIKDISDIIFKKSDLSKNFTNIDFVNEDLQKNDNDDIDNWEAILHCPAGIKLIDGNRNILSSFADSNNHSGFSLGIVGNGMYSTSNPGNSYIFKDIDGNYYPNKYFLINFENYGVKYDPTRPGVIMEEFKIRYKIRKNNENKYDVFIFINEKFAISIENGGCKLNDIIYWGTPKDGNNPYREYGIYDDTITYPYIGTKPMGLTILLQSIYINYIEDFFRPDIQDTGEFIDKIIYKSDDFYDISRISQTDILDRTLTYINNHTEKIVTSNITNFTDISVNTKENYPVRLSYNTIYDENIMPHWDFSSNMISDICDNKPYLKTLTNSSNWGDNNYQVNLLNYTRIFDAGEGASLIIDFTDDFQFFHEGNNKAFDRLEIVAGEISDNCDNEIVWDFLKNDNKPITWLHTFNHGGPISDFDLSKNSELDANAIPRDALPPIQTITKVGFDTNWNQLLPNGDLSGFGYQDPNYWGTNPGDQGDRVTAFVAWVGAPGTARYSHNIHWLLSDADTDSPLVRFLDPVHNAGGAGHIHWKVYEEQTQPYFNYQTPGDAHLPINVWDIMKTSSVGDIIYTDDANNIIDNNYADISFSTIKYYIWSTSGTGLTDTSDNQTYAGIPSNGIINDQEWKLFGFYRWDKYIRTIKTKTTFEKTKTYGTHNYDISDNSGIDISLCKNDWRNENNNVQNDGIVVLDKYLSPRILGKYKKNEFGVDVTSLGFNSDITALNLDIRGSILPMNKERAIDILNFIEGTSYNYNSHKNDARIWRINTNKRFVRINYYAIKSYKNNKFNIRLDRTLNSDEIDNLRDIWISKNGDKKTIFQKNKGIMPVNLNMAYETDLCGNQIESICQEIKSTDLKEPIQQFSNSNFHVFNKNEVPYISTYSYNIREGNQDVIISSRIKKTDFSGNINGYKYDDNRNLRELNIYPDPRNDPSNNSSGKVLSKIKQKYVYTCKNYNNPRKIKEPYISKKPSTTIELKSSTLSFDINSQINLFRRNLNNYWLGDLYDTYIHFYLYVWEPFSKYLPEKNGKVNVNFILNDNNVDNALLKQKIDFDINLSDISGNNFLTTTNDIDNDNIIIWKNERTPTGNEKNQFDFLIEFKFPSNYYYKKKSVGIPDNNEIQYILQKFRGVYIFYWTYKVFQPLGLYENITPLTHLKNIERYNIYNVDAQTFDTGIYIKDDFIYDPKSPIMSWDNDNEHSFTIGLSDDDKKDFKEFLRETTQYLKNKESNQTDISAVEIYLYLWTPNNCEYDTMLNEDVSSNVVKGWKLPNDYNGKLDPRIKMTPYKDYEFEWDPSFPNEMGDSEFGYNFNTFGVKKKIFTYKASDISIVDLTFDDVQWYITLNDISFNDNDIIYGNTDKLPNTLKYIKKNNATGEEYSIPYLTRWGYNVYEDLSNNKTESRVIKSTSALPYDGGFDFRFKFNPNYYFELDTTDDNFNGTTNFIELLNENKDRGITFAYKDGAGYLVFIIDGSVFQFCIMQPPNGYLFNVLDEMGNKLFDENNEEYKMPNQTYKVNYKANNFNFYTGFKINNTDFYFNSPSPEIKYKLYVRKSTNPEKVFFNTFSEKHHLIKYLGLDIRNRQSDWLPISADYYYSSSNQYNYGVLFSNFIEEEDFLNERDETNKFKIDACGRCRPINHSSKEYFNNKYRYANISNIANQISRTAAARTIGNNTSIC